MLDLAASALTLRKTTLRNSACDGLRARQILERALTNADWAPVGLPRTAILFVRKLAPQARLCSANSSHAFRMEVRAELARNLEHARRPWIDGDATSAAAILFLNEVELAACLIRDWLRGRIQERWWWRSVLGSLSITEWLLRHVFARGEILAATTETLMQSADAISWYARITTSETIVAEMALHTTYGISIPASRPRSDDSAHRKLRSESVHVNAALHRSALSPALRMLMDIAPETSVADLVPPQRRLLAAALTVRRRLAWARSIEFVQALEDLDEQRAVDERPETLAQAVNLLEDASPPDRSVRTDSGVVSAHSAPSRTSGRTNAVVTVHAISAVEVNGRAGGSPTTGITDAEPARTLPRRSASHIAVDETQSLNERDDRTRPTTMELSERVLSSATAGRSPIVPSNVAVPLEEPANRLLAMAHSVAPIGDVRTRFGGIFYLLNVALALGLYGDFSAPRTKGLALSPWDFLALIGSRWFGAQFERDAIWNALSELAGRTTRVRPGEDFVPPDDWIMPGEWLSPFGAPEVYVRSSARRLQLIHRAGFVVLDVARQRVVSVRNQCEPYCESLGVRILADIPRRSRHKRMPRDPVVRWAGWLLIYIEARLALALQLKDRRDAATLVCRHEAHLSTSAIRLDVTLSLSDVPIAIRCAGLDRDPGWIPAAGREVRFHFQ